MAKVNATITVTKDGIAKAYTLREVDYAAFYLAQLKVVDLIVLTTRWGLAGLLGQPSAHTGAPTGNVGYTYVADGEEGWNSSGSNLWNGIPQDAAEEIAATLENAFAPLAS